MAGPVSSADAALIRDVAAAVARQDPAALRKMPNVALPTHPNFWGTLSAYGFDLAEPSETVLNDQEAMVVPYSDGRGFGIEVPLRSKPPNTEVVILSLELIVAHDPHQVRISHHYR
jgi:hypothetical protein